MQREILLTADGSHTISIPAMDTTYHSKHGAIGESRHVFIEAGFLPLVHTNNMLPVNILEIGFGTGLNALLTLQAAVTCQIPVHYTGVEKFPLSKKETDTLNYGELLSMQEPFQLLHGCDWEQPVLLNDLFTLEKREVSVFDFNTDQLFNCIYFDAFSPSVQPELWTQPVFEKLRSFLQPGGTLLTYCSKSVVRHAMTAAGFRVEKIPGPWGKREIIRSFRF